MLLNTIHLMNDDSSLSQQNTENVHKFPVKKKKQKKSCMKLQMCPFFSIKQQNLLRYVLSVEMLCPDLLSAGHFSGALARSCHSTFIQSQLQAKHYFSQWLTWLELNVSSVQRRRGLYSSIVDKLKEQHSFRF